MEDGDWRDNTVLLLDNATYHRSKEVKEHIVKLGVTVALSGQYSYDAAPVERFFAHFKKEQLNPEHIKTGKK